MDEWLTPEQLKELERSLKECDERNPRKSAKKHHRYGKKTVVGNKPIDKLKGLYNIDYKIPKEYWLNMKRINRERRHDRWINWNLTVKYNVKSFYKKK